MRVCPNDGTRLYKVDDSDPVVGGVIDGRFRVDYTLGVGGMGTVYGGVQLSVNRDVAIKVLRSEISNREVALERFFREAKTISRLAHPNIVKLIDFGQDEERGLLYLVMELVRGQNLGDLLAGGRLRTALALDVVYQVCGALTEPHAEGVIHRDLKPDNLLLVPVSDGTLQVKVLDFGIARFMESNTQLTGTGMICGTPAYMAPEQAQNERLDARTDLYALGVMLYEMLSGWPPFSGTSSLQVMLKHIQETPPMLRELLPHAALPESIEDVVYTLMAKERSLRPETAREVRDKIDALRIEFDLAPVRFSAGSGGRELDEMFAPYVLPKLPRADGEQSGPTQVLRRETGLQAMAPGVAPRGISNDTQADPALGVTGPLSPEQKRAVMADGVVNVQTRGGGQQAWTPGDQRAVRSIKDTMDGVDAHGLTETSSPSTPRRTMVEADDSDVIVQAVPRTEDQLQPAERPADVTATKERKPVSRSTNYLPLIVIAVVATAAIGGATMLIDQRLTAMATPAPPPEPLPLVEAPLEEPAVEPVDPRKLADLATAASWAQRGVVDAVRVAGASAKPRKVEPKPRVQKPVETKPAVAKPPSTDRIINELGLRKDDG